MANELTLVDSLLYENGALRNHCRRIGKLLGEQETLFLQRKGDWTPGLVDELASQKLNLEQAVLTIEDALVRHKQLHGELPSSFLGAPLAEALEMEHDDMLEAIKKARAEIPAEFKNLTRAELLAKSLQIRSAHESACVLVEAHLSKEDAILELLRRALRAAANKL
jgi:hypothetical protein